MTRRAGIALLAAPLAAFGQEVEDKETIRRSFPVAAGVTPEVLVDNLNGFIHVMARPGRTVEVTAERLVTGRSQDRLEDARREVKLDADQRGNMVRLYVDGPFRVQDGINWRGDRYYGYKVRYDFTITVPAEAQVILKSVNQGDVRLEGTLGDFDLQMVNGPMTLVEVGGAGTAHTVNGAVKASWVKVPPRTVSLRTINGDIDVTAPANLGADLWLKSFRKDAYTDFALTSTPLPPLQGEQKDGHFVYRGHQYSRYRVGSGGPEMKLDTMNGTIRLMKRSGA